MPPSCPQLEPSAGDMETLAELPEEFPPVPKPSMISTATKSYVLRHQSSAHPVRGISVLDFLRLGPGLHQRNTYTKEEEQIRLYGMSHLMDQKSMSHFISHTWRSNYLLKHLALLYSMNSKLALIGGHVAALLTFITIIAVRFGAGIMPPVVHVPKWLLPSPLQQQPLEMSFFCVIAGCFMQTFLLLFGHYVNPRSREDKVFFDKVCICQYDQDLKRDGIFAIGEVLHKTEHMVILWDKDYFERLWCTYEVAAFARRHKFDNVNNVTIMPLVLSTYASGMFLSVSLSTGFLLALVNVFTQYIVIPKQWSLMCYFLFYLFAGCVLYWLPKYYASSLLMQAQEDLRAQLQAFSVKDAKVHDEADRQFVEAEIEAWFGSLDDFNDKVRSEVKAVVMKSMGGQWYCLPYFALIFENTSIFWIFVFDAVAVAEELSAVSKLIVLGLGEHLVLVPLYVFASNIFYRWVKETFSKPVRILLNTLWMLIVGCWLPAWMFLATQLDAGWSALLLSPGAAIVAILALRQQFGCALPRKGPSTSTGGEQQEPEEPVGGP